MHYLFEKAALRSAFLKFHFWTSETEPIENRGFELHSFHFVVKSKSLMSERNELDVGYKWERPLT